MKIMFVLASNDDSETNGFVGNEPKNEHWP